MSQVKPAVYVSTLNGVTLTEYINSLEEALDLASWHQKHGPQTPVSVSSTDPVTKVTTTTLEFPPPKPIPAEHRQVNTANTRKTDNSW